MSKKRVEMVEEIRQDYRQSLLDSFDEEKWKEILDMKEEIKEKKRKLSKLRRKLGKQAAKRLFYLMGGQRTVLRENGRKKYTVKDKSVYKYNSSHSKTMIYLLIDVLDCVRPDHFNGDKDKMEAVKKMKDILRRFDNLYNKVSTDKKIEVNEHNIEDLSVEPTAHSPFGFNFLNTAFVDTSLQDYESYELSIHPNFVSQTIDFKKKCKDKFPEMDFEKIRVLAKTVDYFYDAISEAYKEFKESYDKLNSVYDEIENVAFEHVLAREI